MMPITFQDVVVSLAALALSFSLWQGQRRRQPLPHLPGPPGLPFVGNLRDIPLDRSWVTYVSWSKKYGSDVVRLSMFGSNIIIVNSLDAATELLERRSSIYSDRDAMVMLNELCGYSWNLGFQRYGNAWREARRAVHQSFGPESIRQHQHAMISSTHTFLRNLARDKLDVMTELRHLAGMEIMKTAYGIDVLPQNDPYIETAEHALQAISATTNAGAYLVDTLPILKYIPSWFPGASFKRHAMAWKYYVNKMREDPWQAVKRRLAAGELVDCAATFLLGALEENENVGYDEDIIQSALGSMYSGGADTTVSSLGSFFLAMVLYPEYQNKARRQVDQVCPGRLPEFSDRHSLPYVDALVKESLRWNPVIPLNIPHCLQEDDIFNGYFIPKGTVVVANNWAVLHDETIYPDPMNFNPERYLKNGQIDPDVLDPTTACFGFGRRICPGRFLAYESMWITIASALAVLTISKAMGSEGVPITPVGDYIEGFLCYPESFECDIQLRSTEHGALLEATALFQA